MEINDANIAFEPLPGSSQELAVIAPCHHILYHGTRGPGKTAAQLFRYLRNVGRGYGRFWHGIIFDRHHKNLADVVKQSKKFILKLDDGARFLESASAYKWVWPTGEELLFRHINKPSDYENYHGHELPFQGHNELTKQPTSELYDLLMSCNRSSFNPEKDTPHTIKKDGTVEYHTHDGKPLPPIPLEVFSTCNPSGVGHNWVKNRFILRGAPGEVVRYEYDVFNPQTQAEEKVTRTQTHLFGSYKENPFLDPSYIAELTRLTENDSNLRDAWLKGSWDITSGGCFDDLWDASVHIIPRLRIPSNWVIDRSFDWGSTHPYSVGFWAVSNGEEVTDEKGNTHCFPAGTLIQIDEIYGTEEIGTNKGLRIGASEIAQQIAANEEVLQAQGWISTKPRAGPADNQIYNVNNADDLTIADNMKAKGIQWKKSNKSPGSRVGGLQLFRDRLRASIIGEGPGIYFCRNCEASISTIPILQYDDKKIDDVDTHSEDHAWDMVRYRVLYETKNYAKVLPVQFPY